MYWVRPPPFFLRQVNFCDVRTDTDKDHNIVREEARELMRSIQSRSVECDPERKVCPLLSFLPHFN